VTGTNSDARSSSIATIERLRITIDSVLQDYIGDEPYALLDFPNYANVGDSAIWAGELVYLRRRCQRDPSYVCAHNADWAALAQALPNGPILLSGGGNFGDIWPSMQYFREEVLDRNPGRTVIQLPQSIQFNDQSNLRQTAKAIARHKSFVLLVRDQASYVLATSNFDCDVRLCPDMAFCLDRLARRRDPTHSLVLLLRTDKEAISETSWSALKLPDDAVVDDWLSEPPNTDRRAKFLWGVEMLKSLDLRQLSPMARRVRYYDQLADLRIRRGVAVLSQGRQLITDRLHGHIIGTLLDLPQVVLDNSYGKINRFMDTWQSDWTGVRRAANLSVALNEILLSRGRPAHLR
jgi:exopolysaccharide biosynthesis predicted pyruvyltransferase EpsI